MTKTKSKKSKKSAQSAKSSDDQYLREMRALDLIKCMMETIAGLDALKMALGPEPTKPSDPQRPQRPQRNHSLGER